MNATRTRALTRVDLRPGNLAQLLIVMEDEALRPVLTSGEVVCCICGETDEESVTFAEVNGKPTPAAPICLGCFPDVITEDAAEGLVEVYVKARP